MKYEPFLAFVNDRKKEYDNLRDGQIIQFTNMYPVSWTVMVQFLLEKHELTELYSALRTYREEIDKDCRAVNKLIKFINPYLEAERDGYLKLWLEEEEEWEREQRMFENEHT